MLINKKTMTHEQWLEERKRHIGGSDAPAVVGLSPWMTPLKLWQIKRGEEAVEPNFQMEMGTLTEPLTREWYAKENEIDAREDPFIHVSDEHPFMSCNLDGVIYKTDGGMELLEVKHTGSRQGWGDKGTDEVPEMYNVQVQHCMAVTGLKVTRFAVVFGNRPPVEYRVERNDEIIDSLTKMEEEFWRMVENGIPPEPLNMQDVNSLYRVDNGKNAQASTNVASIVAKLKELDLNIQNLVEVREGYKETIKKVMGENQNLVYENELLATWKSHEVRRLDTKKLRAERPEIYNAYANTTIQRRFNAK